MKTKARLNLLLCLLLLLGAASGCATLNLIGGETPREKAAVIVKTGYHMADSYYGGVLQNYKWAEEEYAAKPSPESGATLESWKERQKDAGRLYAEFEHYHSILKGVYDNAESSDDLIEAALDQVLDILSELQRKSIRKSIR